MSKGEPIKTVNYISCLIHPIIYYCQKLVELVISWDGQGMVVQKFELEKPSVFGKHFLTPWASKNPKTYAILPCFHVLMFSPSFFLHVSSLKHYELLVCETIHVFGFPHDFGALGIQDSCSLLCSSFFPRAGKRFC